MFRALAVSLLIALSLSACAKNRIEQLTDRADAYNRSIRWGSLTAASAVIDQEVRRRLLVRLSAELRRNKIVDYSIIDLGVDAEKKKGSVVVEYNFYGSDQTLRYRQEIQTWAYNSKEKNWFLTAVREMPNAPQ